MKIQLIRAWSEFLLIPKVWYFRSIWCEKYGLIAVATCAALVATKFINIPGKAPDFTVFWAAATHAYGPVYNSDFLSPLQNGPPGPRPFANPPTFLLMLLPIGFLQFKHAFVAWVSVSLVTFVATGLRLTRFAWLALLSPTLIFVAIIGQTTLLAGSMAVLGLAMAGKRSGIAGVALAVAACIKPQLAILAPLALLFLRDMRAIVAAGFAVLTVALAATLVFGIGVWAAWLQSLAGFQSVTNDLAIRRLSLPFEPPVIIIGGIVFVFLMALAARHNDRPRLIISTVGGSLLLSPYSAHYESVILLLPALALLRLDWRILPIGFLLSGAATTTIPFAIVIFLLCIPAGEADAPTPHPQSHMSKRSGPGRI